MQTYPARGRQQLAGNNAVSSLHIICIFQLNLQGQTALHTATIHGKEDMVVLLLASGAETDPGSEDNAYTIVSSLLMLASACLLSGPSRLLAPKHSDNSSHLSCIQYVDLLCINCLLQAIKMLIRCICTSPNRMWLVHVPLFSGMHTCMRSALTELTVALTCFQGQAALCWAIVHHYDHIVKLLMSHGANPNSTDINVSGFMSLVSMMFVKPLWPKHRSLAHHSPPQMFGVSFQCRMGDETPACT